MRRLFSVAPVLLWLITPLAFAQLPGITSQPLPGGGQSWSLPVQTLVFITSLTFIPAILLMMTSFTRIIIVFGLLRNALGTPSAPPNQVLLGLALFLTFFIMSPVIDKIYVDAYQPFSEEKISMQEALEKGAQPLREFMLRQTREADLGLFARLANTGPLQGPEAVPMRILLPAYVTSELKTAFQIGFTIFIPFLIIDLVIASVLMALGMMMVPPATIALLLTLNLALGLLNRMAPQLSIFVIGFPLTLTVGISLMAALMPLIAPFCEHLFSEIFNLLADIISELPLI